MDKVIFRFKNKHKMRCWNFGFHKGRRISGTTEQLSASQEGIYAMEFVGKQCKIQIEFF
jgi:hypothetical protein